MKRNKFIAEIEIVTDGEADVEAVETAINLVLDEPPCSWGSWTVGAATVVKIAVFDEEEEP